MSLATVTVTELELYWTPSTSRATAVRVWDPLLAVTVFQETEYGPEVSSAPRLAPSSLNCTPATVREPTTLALALTVTVPLTVEPDTGAVIVTIRLPIGGSSCARTFCGAVQPSTVDRIAVQTRLPILFITRRSFA